MKSWFIFFFTLLPLPSLFSQTSFERMDSVDFIENSITLMNPFAGGLNQPMFSEIDLDGNADLDLFLFDRTGNKSLTFLNLGTATFKDYKYAPQYQDFFPSNLNDYCLLRDINCDGKKDIFTGNNNQGLRIYINTSTGGNISFALLYSTVNSDYGGGPEPMFINTGDIPAVDDVDFDGDLDLLTFNSSGASVEWHKNMAMENGSCDSIEFVVADECWGKFEEDSFNNTCTLNVSCKGITGGGLSNYNGTRHSGSTLALFDEDHDGDYEAVLGDVVFDNLVYLHNAGSAAFAQMDSQSTSFPVYDTPVNIDVYPGAMFLDLDNDGNKDMVTSPNGGNSSVNYNSVWMYHNEPGITGKDSFIYVSSDFLQNTMIDCGAGAFPAYFDYNGDSLLDLLIGDNNYETGPSFNKAQMRLYENTGTNTKPEFTLVDRNYLSLTTVFNPLREAFAPTFGDLNNDGDLDLLIGEKEGKIIYFENTAGAGNPVNFVLSQADFSGIDVGANSVPVMADLNRDGLMDILVGETGGNIDYFENIGTTSFPQFPSSPTIEMLGNVDVQPICCTGYSAPFIYENASGDYELLVGSEKEGFWRYNNIEGNISGAFTKIDSLFGMMREGTRASIIGTDINGDGKMDWTIGNYRGGITIYDGTTIVSNEKPTVKEQSILQLYPNPSNDFIEVVCESKTAMKHFSIFSSDGRLVREINPSSTAEKIKIDVNDFMNGIYFLSVDLVDGSRVTQRFCVVR